MSQNVTRNGQPVTRLSAKRSASGRHQRLIEPLEGRQLLSAFLDAGSGLLTVTGTGDADVITLKLENTGGTDEVVVNVNDVPAEGGRFTAADVYSVVVNGLAGNDLLDLSGGPAALLGATLNGGAGDDTLISGPGSDVLNGDGGNDTYKFKDNWGSDSITESGGDTGDTLDFSAVTGQLFYVINNGPLTVNSTGGSSVNHVQGLIENFIGGQGNDVFRFQPGASIAGTINGGGGSNALDYSLEGGAVNVNLGAGTASAVGGGVQNINIVMGGAGNDSLVGGSADDSLDGGAGNDTLEGGAGNDTLEGGNGDDVLDGGAGTNSLNGEAGNDIYRVGGATGQTAFGEPLGADAALDFSGSADNLVFTIKTNGDVEVRSGSTVLATGTNTMSALVGGNGNDSFVFQKAATFAGSIDGGAGTNTLDYRAYRTALNINLVTGAATAIAGNESHIQNVVGGAAADVITGDDGPNSFWGMAGNDRLDGGAGDDGLHGGLGNDVLTGGAGTDSLFGDAGNDRIYAKDTVRDVVKGAAGRDTVWRDKRIDSVTTCEVLR